MEENPETTEQLVEVPAEPTPSEQIAVDPHECQYPDGLEHCIICGKPIEKTQDAPPQAEIVDTPAEPTLPIPPTEGVANEGTVPPTTEGVAIPTENITSETPLQVTPDPVIDCDHAYRNGERVCAMCGETKMGRPIEYKPEYCDLLKEHMAKGYSFEAFAADINSHKDTLYEWVKTYPDFSDSKRIGESVSLKFWEGLGVGGVVGQIDGFNTTAWIFNMKNRHKWSDRNEVIGDGGAPLSMVIDIVRQKEETVEE